MKDQSKTKQTSMRELTSLRKRIAELERLESERKRMEEQLHRSEGNFKLLHETMLQGVVFQDVEGGMVSMNPAAVRILGKSPEEYLCHASAIMAQPSIREDGSFLPESDHPSMVALRSGKELRNVVMGVYNPREKDYRWITVRAMPLFRPEEDKPHQVYIIFDDITESRRIEKALTDSEVRYRRLFETAQDGILILDAETGQISDVNPFLVEMLGYSHEDFLGKRLWEIGVFKDITASKAAFLELQSKGYVRYNDLPLETKDGRPMAVEFVSNVYMVNHHKVIQCNIRDITERKHIAEALQKAHSQLERRVEERTVELRTAVFELKAMKDKLEAENIYFRHEIKTRSRFGDIIGKSDGLKHILHRAEQVAPANTTVLILGETGTGKELIAFAIHDMSPRRDRPMITVNCAALPANLIESELFGREKGAFTGADARQVGRFEIAHGSTICLDEIGELPLELQAKLLRAIQHSEFERLGSSNTIKVDVRIIATTNRDLEEEVRKGRFRQDLYYRLNVFPITVPPLRQRKEDIPLMVQAFLERYSRKMGKQIESIHKNTLKALQEYPWPGNVRELESIIERAVILCPGSVLQLVDKLEASSPPLSSAVRTLEEAERNQIIKMLSEARWHIEGKDGAAVVLGLHPSTLRARMHKLGIIRPGPREPGS